MPDASGALSGAGSGAIAGSVFGPVGTVVGGAVGLLGGLLSSGKKPVVPAFNPVNLDTEQQKAIAGNQKNFAAAGDLATQTNTFNQSELSRMLRAAIPNYDALVGKQGEVVGSMLSGQLSPDVIAQIQRNAAERAGSGGYGNTAMSRNLEARDLGLTSLQLQTQGLSAAERWMQSTKQLAVPGQMDVASMFLSPSQRVAATVANNTGQYNRDLYANTVAAAPDPTMKAIGSFLTQAGGLAVGYGMSNSFTPAGTSTGGVGASNSIFSPMLQPLTQPDLRA